MIADYMIEQMVKVLQELVNFCRWIAGFAGSFTLVLMIGVIIEKIKDR